MASSKMGFGGYPVYRAYRPTRARSLMILSVVALMAISMGLSSGWADDSSSNEAWPEQVYFPQRAEHDADSSPIQSGKPAPASSGQFADGSPGITPLPKAKKHWYFRKKSKEEASDGKDTFHAVPPKPSAQQADPPASPYPLLRLPMPIITDQGIVPPGIYLLKTEVDDPKIGSMTFVQKAPKAVLNGEKPLLLTRQNQVVAIIPIHPAILPDENQEETGTTSPITPVNPRIPPPIKVRAELSADQKSIHLVVMNGKQQFESDEYTVGIDLRHKLTF